MLALERQNITFRLCVHRDEKPPNLLRLTEKDQSKYCLHIKLLKPRIILNSTRVQHFVIGWLYDVALCLLSVIIGRTIVIVKIEELSAQSQRVT